MTDSFYTINTGSFIATVDRATTQVRYVDLWSKERAIEYVTAHLNEVTLSLRPIVEFALAQSHRPVLLKKGIISETHYYKNPAIDVSARAELSVFGTVDQKKGYFWFNFDLKNTALNHLKYGCRKDYPGYAKSNCSYYAANLGPLGSVIVEKIHSASGIKPWVVRYALATQGPEVER